MVDYVELRRTVIETITSCTSITVSKSKLQRKTACMRSFYLLPFWKLHVPACVHSLVVNCACMWSFVANWARVCSLAVNYVRVRSVTVNCTCTCAQFCCGKGQWALVPMQNKIICKANKTQIFTNSIFCCAENDFKFIFQFVDESFFHSKWLFRGMFWYIVALKYFYLFVSNNIYRYIYRKSF